MGDVFELYGDGFIISVTLSYTSSLRVKKIELKIELKIEPPLKNNNLNKSI